MIFVVVPVLAPPLLVRVPDATWVAVLTHADSADEFSGAAVRFTRC
jgi:hypothetical protein